MSRIFLKIILPWFITLGALYLAFRGVEWHLLIAHLKDMRIAPVIGAVALTALSYTLRSVRWPLLFPNPCMSFISSWRVLVLGFFMNNILPARAGELVRAHFGGKVTGESRMIVLATIASERLADGLTISLMFALIILLIGPGNLDPAYAQNLLYVAYLFAAVACCVVAVIMLRRRLFSLADRVASRLNSRASTYTLSKAQLFIEGLSPLCKPKRAIAVAAWSGVIWSVELAVFYLVSLAFSTPLSLSGCVLFLVAVNFSSLVPAAPGGFGVIELVAKKVLLSVGVQSDELALCMVLTQHIIQYAVIGLPGAFLLSNLRSQVKGVDVLSEE
jgi:hypothetical protein